MINIIIVIALGIGIGVVLAFPISNMLFKRHKRKVVDNSVKKIMNQKTITLKTAKGKPIPLNFKNDGKEVDLKKDINKEIEAKNKAELKKFNQIERERKKVEAKIEKIKAQKKDGKRKRKK